MQDIATNIPELTIHTATGADAALVVDYMKKLGTYQKMAYQITATEPAIRRLLDNKLGEAVFAQYNGAPCGFIYFCQKSSAFTGRSGLYIDGFLMDEHVRYKGFGKIMMGYLCRLALDRKCQMLEWGCMDWNAPTIQFYRGLGAYSLDEMTIFRFTPENLEQNAALFDTGI
jgi:GNAT superfamily N-acetyltransferase